MSSTKGDISPYIHHTKTLLSDGNDYLKGGNLNLALEKNRRAHLMQSTVMHLHHPNTPSAARGGAKGRDRAPFSSKESRCNSADLQPRTGKHRVTSRRLNAYHLPQHGRAQQNTATCSTGSKGMNTRSQSEDLSARKSPRRIRSRTSNTSSEDSSGYRSAGRIRSRNSNPSFPWQSPEDFKDEGRRALSQKSTWNRLSAMSNQGAALRTPEGKPESGKPESSWKTRTRSPTRSSNPSPRVNASRSTSVKRRDETSQPKETSDTKPMSRSLSKSATLLKVSIPGRSSHGSGSFQLSSYKAPKALTRMNEPRSRSAPKCRPVSQSKAKIKDGRRQPASPDHQDQFLYNGMDDSHNSTSSMGMSRSGPHSKMRDGRRQPASPDHQDQTQYNGMDDSYNSRFSMGMSRSGTHSKMRPNSATLATYVNQRQRSLDQSNHSIKSDQMDTSTTNNSGPESPIGAILNIDRLFPNSSFIRVSNSGSESPIGAILNNDRLLPNSSFIRKRQNSFKRTAEKAETSESKTDKAFHESLAKLASMRQLLALSLGKDMKTCPTTPLLNPDLIDSITEQVENVLDPTLTRLTYNNKSPGVQALKKLDKMKNDVREVPPIDEGSPGFQALQKLQELRLEAQMELDLLEEKCGPIDSALDQNSNDEEVHYNTEKEENCPRLNNSVHPTEGANVEMEKLDALRTVRIAALRELEILEKFSNTTSSQPHGVENNGSSMDNQLSNSNEPGSPLQRDCQNASPIQIEQHSNMEISSPHFDDSSDHGEKQKRKPSSPGASDKMGDSDKNDEASNGDTKAVDEGTLALLDVEDLTSLDEEQMRDLLKQKILQIDMLKRQLAAHGEEAVDEIVSLDDAKNKLKDSVEELLKGNEEAQKEFDRWDRYIRNHPEHIHQQKLELEKWDDDQRDANNEALKWLRSFVPEDIWSTSIESLHSRGLAPKIAKRVWERKALWLCRADSTFIAKMHVADLKTKFSYQGCDLKELRAVWFSVPESFPNDTNGEKAQWRESLQERLKELVAKQEKGELAQSLIQNYAYKGAPEAGPFDPLSTPKKMDTLQSEAFAPTEQFNQVSKLDTSRFSAVTSTISNGQYTDDTNQDMNSLGGHNNVDKSDDTPAQKSVLPQTHCKPSISEVNPRPLSPIAAMIKKAVIPRSEDASSNSDEVNPAPKMPSREPAPSTSEMNRKPMSPIAAMIKKAAIPSVPPASQSEAADGTRQTMSPIAALIKQASIPCSEDVSSNPEESSGAKIPSIDVMIKGVSPGLPIATTKKGEGKRSPLQKSMMSELQAKLKSRVSES